MAWRCPPLHLPNWNNLWKWKQTMVKSPCIGKCNYNSELEVCSDCHRTKQEISTWYVMTDDEKLAVLERLLNETSY